MFLSDHMYKHPPGSILDTSHDLYVSYVCILCHFIIYLTETGPEVIKLF